MWKILHHAKKAHLCVKLPFARVNHSVYTNRLYSLSGVLSNRACGVPSTLQYVRNSPQSLCRVLHTEACKYVEQPPSSTYPSTQITITQFDKNGNFTSKAVRKSELLTEYGIQPRDIRFSTMSSLYVRGTGIILRLQHIKAIITTNSLVLLDSDHGAIEEFIPELQEKLKSINDALPFEFAVLEILVTKMLTVLEDRLSELHPSVVNVLNNLLDPNINSVDRGHLHVLLLHSKSLSEFTSLTKDIEGTLADVLDNEADLAEMYLSRWTTPGKYPGGRGGGGEGDGADIEEISDILESYLMQAEDLLSRSQQLRELITQSESIILINLDSQRNIMMRLSLQLEMGVFAATMCGLVGLSFGMNLSTSLEESPHAFWIISGLMVASAGLLWRRLLIFLGKNSHNSKNMSKNIF